MAGIENFPDYHPSGIQHNEFSPYESNGGTIVAVGGDNFVIIAADSRLSTFFSIHTRNQNKLFKLAPTTVLGSAGCWCDALALTSVVKSYIQKYEHAHQKTMSTKAVAQMLAILMYSRRFFPYYLSNVLVGFDEEEKGCVYSYDPIGHCELSNGRAVGTAGAIIQPILDNQVCLGNENVDKGQKLTQERALNVIIDAFVSAAERDIYTGDSINVHIITQAGIDEIRVRLRKD